MKAKNSVEKKRRPYKQLVIECLTDLNKEGDRKKPTSVVKIMNWIEKKYFPDSFSNVSKLFIKKAIKSASENGIISRIRGSFVLNKAKKEQKVEKKKKNKRAIKKRVETVAKKREKREKREKVSKEVDDSVQNKRMAKIEEKGEEKSAKAPVGIKFDHFWQFETRNYGWVNYEPSASDIVEEVYRGYLANRGGTDVRAVKSGDWEYQVDFMAMKQTNLQHNSHTTRSIRRVPVLLNTI
eukprot:TRINITY_DN8622_c1_g1_i1.p1 TRINITY_DN8622_c1_g1~~TRINITY_DN8622_c1_g1_i1.p1  ORF type:complete len:269 (-),score=92.68 TRINITY_DN8622_c1_g1_i1:33-746(-)